MEDIGRSLPVVDLGEKSLALLAASFQSMHFARGGSCGFDNQKSFSRRRWSLCTFYRLAHAVFTASLGVHGSWKYPFILSIFLVRISRQLHGTASFELFGFC
jgi:hypothetical protein